MTYAADNRISKAPLDGGIKISAEQYRELLTAMQEGRKFEVRDGSPFILSREKRTVYSTETKRPKEISENALTPDGYTDDKPSEFDQWDGTKWVEDDRARADSEAKTARAKRDALLASTDWTQLPDAPVDVSAWADYRQALRDVPQQDGFPADIAWPEQPPE